MSEISEDPTRGHFDDSREREVATIVYARCLVKVSL